MTLIRQNCDWPSLAARARQLESPCRACARNCGARRDAGESGFCGAGLVPRVTKFFITYGEEAFLNPAYMLYFSHCNMRCAYCSNAEFIDRDFTGGVDFDADATAMAIDRAFENGRIRAVQLLGGEPTGALSACIEVARRLQSAVPVVWNSNFYFSAETFAILAPWVDFWVADLKFGNDRCALAYAATPDYLAVVTDNLRRVPRGQLLIRHLPLGGHTSCCTAPVLEFLAREFPDTPVSFHTLMPDPQGRCQAPDAGEQEWLDGEVRRLGLKREYALFNPAAPVAAVEEVKPRFSGEILILRDGRVVAQDVPDAVRTLLNTLLEKNQ